MRYQEKMEKLPSLYWAVARVIKNLRLSAGLTQSQLAGLAGLSEDYISAMERGIQGDSITALLHIGGVLKIEGHELLRRIEVEMRNNPEPPARKVGKPQKRQKVVAPAKAK